MKINKISIKQTETVTAALKAIDSVDKKNSTIIVVKTDQGNFSNYKTVFDKQGLDVEALQEGDMLRITYTIHKAKNEVEFKNFTKIERN